MLIMLYPLFFMVLLILTVGCIAIKHRFSCIKNKSINIKYFQLMQGENIPLAVTKKTRCFSLKTAVDSRKSAHQKQALRSEFLMHLENLRILSRPIRSLRDSKISDAHQ